MNKLNAEELIIGTCFILAFSPWLGWWTVFLAPLSGMFWALTGDGYSKRFRRLGVPLLLIGGLYGNLGLWQAIYGLPTAFLGLSCGYGIPTPGVDEGSAIGRFWYKIVNKDDWIVNVLTRGTTYLILVTPFYMILYIF